MRAQETCPSVNRRATGVADGAAAAPARRWCPRKAKPVNIAVASGKGGTGKTIVATHLVRSAEAAGKTAAYLDCDVEAPNGHVFLRPEIAERRLCEVPVPEVDDARCTRCGACGQACRFSAIVCLPDRVLTFPTLCHACGGCALVCPGHAIRETTRTTGTIETGRSGGVRFVRGVLNVGEAMSRPLIRAVRRAAPDAEVVVIDAPPGTSCPVIESVRGSDYVVLVTEPTPFGLHDLKLALGMVRALGLPAGVVINRAGLGDGRARQLCRAEGAEVLAEIPNDRRVAEAYSRGELAGRRVGGYQQRIDRLLERIRAAAMA